MEAGVSPPGDPLGGGELPRPLALEEEQALLQRSRVVVVPQAAAKRVAAPPVSPARSGGGELRRQDGRDGRKENEQATPSRDSVHRPTQSSRRLLPPQPPRTEASRENRVTERQLRRESRTPAASVAHASVDRSGKGVIPGEVGRVGKPRRAVVHALGAAAAAAAPARRDHHSASVEASEISTLNYPLKPARKFALHENWQSGYCSQATHTSSTTWAALSFTREINQEPQRQGRAEAWRGGVSTP